MLRTDNLTAIGPTSVTGRAFLAVIVVEDGCRLDINPPDGNPAGWVIEIPGGFRVTCPHGRTVKIHGQENLMEVAGVRPEA